MDTDIRRDLVSGPSSEMGEIGKGRIPRSCLVFTVKRTSSFGAALQFQERPQSSLWHNVMKNLYIILVVHIIHLHMSCQLQTKRRTVILNSVSLFCRPIVSVSMTQEEHRLICRAVDFLIPSMMQFDARTRSKQLIEQNPLHACQMPVRWETKTRMPKSQTSIPSHYICSPHNRMGIPRSCFYASSLSSMDAFFRSSAASAAASFSWASSASAEASPLTAWL